LLLVLAPLTVVVLTTWFFSKGVDVDKWNARVIAMRAIDQPSLV
jgi:hypothetical protein